MTGESSDHAGNAARPSGWQQASGEGRAQSAAQQARLPAPRSARRSRISLVVACLVVLAIAALVLLRLSSR